MKHFYLVANSSKPQVHKAAERIARYLQGKGATCDGSPQKRQGSDPGCGYTDVTSIPENTECIITLGGDGTLIQAARDLVSLNLPFIGINMGNLGYLTQVSREDEIRAMLDALLADRFSVEKRMMLEGRVVGPSGVKSGIALNDIVLTRNDVLQVLHFQVFLNNVFFNEYMADGIIASTPTGSTAYNLSAGGPIVAPGAKLIVLTPICSHALNSRSIVISPEDTISIRLENQEHRTQTAVFDGDQVIDMQPGDMLEIRQAVSQTTMIRLKEVSFLETLRSKMTRV